MKVNLEKTTKMKIKISENIIREMVTFRKNMGFSREMLAEELGVMPWVIKRLETAYTGNLTIFVALLCYYRQKGFDINALFERGDEGPVVFDPDIF